MSRYLSLFLLLALLPGAPAQTVTPNESAIVVQSPKKIGINLNGPAYYGAAEFYKNLMWRNPGFEPDLYRDKFVTSVNGTATTFTAPSPYDPVVENFWAGATFKLYRGSPKAQICSGTIAGNTTATLIGGPTYNFSSACSSAVAAGDVIILRQAVGCTPEADWESSHAGWWASSANGGKLVSECSSPYDGAQALRLDASASASTAGVTAHIDSGPWDVGILLNGQYTISGYYKTIGSPTFSVAARRNTTGSAGSPFNCPTKTFAASPGWTAFSSVCTGYETNSVGIADISVSFSAQNGIVILDDVGFQRTSGNDPTNTTVFRDELLAALRAHCSGASLNGVPCELRDWAFQNADEIDNTIKPLFQRSIAVNSFNYDYAGGQGTPSMSVGLEEFLELCKAIDAEPYYALPETTGPEDGAHWIEYLNGATSTPYGSKRSAIGQSATWLSVFPTIHLAMGNENWNESNSGQGLGYRAGAPDLYYDYSSDAAGVWGAMRGGASWPAGGTGIDLVLGFQDGNANNGVMEAMTRSAANSGELAPYTQSYVADTSPLTALWNPVLYEVVANTTNSATTFYQQASAVKTYGKVNVYEFDNSTFQGPPNLTQAVLDSFTDAAGYGTATALQALQHLAFGIVDQNFFSLPQYYVPGPNGAVVHHWGTVIDMGGATNAVRPQELGMRMANAAIIGPMYACPVANPTTASLGANHNGEDSTGTPAAVNIPQEYAYCFMSGMQRSMVVINTDIQSSHSLAFAGSQVPTGSVTVTRYAPASISATNEAGGTAPTNAAPQNVAIATPFTVANPSGDTLPPYSITRYDWTSGASGSLIATATSLSASNTAPSAGTSILLTAGVNNASATGTVTFMDGSATVGTATLNAGTAVFNVQAISAGAHSYTAVYGGDAAYAGSTSLAVLVSVGGSYIHTTFNEYGAGHALGGTAPAIDAGGSLWSDPNGDWTYLPGQGITSLTPDLTNPTLIDATHADYVATFGYPAVGAEFLFRYVDLNNYLFAFVYANEVDLYAKVAGSNTTLATIYLANPIGPLQVSLNGASGTITCGGQTASGVIPSSLLSGTSVGFFPRSTGFVISSLDISPSTAASLIPTSTALSATNNSPLTGSPVPLTAIITPSAATGPITLLDNGAAVVSGFVSGGQASYTVPSITAGTHVYTTVFGGDATYAGNTSSPLVVTASSMPNAYVHTVFDEYPANSPLDGTAPAVDNVGATWSDPNGDWAFRYGGGILSDTADLTNPTLIDAAHTNYSATFNFPSPMVYPSLGELLFRYVDLNNYLSVMVYGTEIDLYAQVAGTRTVVATIYPSNTAGQLVITLNGSTGTVASGGKTASGVIPASLLNSSSLGFFSRAPNFGISSLDVSP